MRAHTLLSVFLVVVLAIWIGSKYWARNRDLNQTLRKPTVRPDLSDGGSEVVLGSGHAGEWASLKFAVLNVRTGQKPADAPPWYAKDGDWTFFDCVSPGETSPTVTVGVKAVQPSGSAPIAFSEAVLVPLDRERGSSLVKVFAQAFGLPVPRPKSPQALTPLRFPTAFLGEQQTRTEGGGFQQGGGTWTATKWFLNSGANEAEIYFNYDLAHGQAEFAEKDSEYRESLLKVLATVLRDGPQPPRSPREDPRITEAGPKILDAQLVPNSAKVGWEFALGGRAITLRRRGSDGGTVSAIRLPDLRIEIELARTEKAIDEVVLLNESLDRLLVLERVTKNAEGGWSSEDPTRFWWVDRREHVTRELKGPWPSTSGFAFSRPLSPDSRFVVIQGYERQSGKQYRARVNVVYDLRNGAATTVSPDLDAEPVGWTGEGDQLRLVLLTGNSWEHVERVVYLADPITGTATKGPADAVPQGTDAGLSPDGRLRFVLRPKDRLSITDLKAGRSREFVFHEDDREFAGEESVRWVSPRYLSFNNGFLTLIDAETARMSYPLAAEERRSFRFSPDFEWAATQDESGLWVARVEVPQ